MGASPVMSGWTVHTVLQVARRRGIDLEGVLDGLSFTERSVSSPLSKIPWDDFAIFADRLTVASGGPEPMAALTADMPLTSSAMKTLAGAVVDPRRLYTHFVDWVTRRTNPGLGYRAEELADGRIRIEMRLPVGGRPSMGSWYGTLGMFRGYPQVLGLPPAQVRGQLGLRRAVFLVKPPESRTFAARLARPLRPGSAAGCDPGLELVDDLEFAADDSGVLVSLASVGQRLAAISEPGKLGDSFLGVMRQQFCARFAALWAVEATGRERPLASWGTAPAAARRAFALAIDGRTVGRMEIDSPIDRRGPPSPMLVALLPWVAIAVANAAGPREPGRELDESCRSAAHRWTLTPREAQILRLLVEGCSNRELAESLGSSVRTVENHMARLLQKSGADSRAVLIARVLGA